MKLVRSGALSTKRAVELLTSGPARAFSLDAGTLRVGAAADVVLFHPDAHWTVRPEKMFSKSRNTPFGGWELQGRVIRTFVAGRQVFAVE
jgi:dihydroorotase